MFNIKKKNFSKIDLLLVIGVVGLVILGLVTLYSATLSLDGVSIKTQLIATLMGSLGILVLVFLDYDFLKRMAKYLYILALVLMVLVSLFGTGAERWGSDNWIVLGPISFQPSEFVKLFLIISLARLIEINQNKLNRPLTLLKILVLGGIPIALILKEDFGTAFATSGLVLAMLFAAGLSWKYILAGIASVIVAIPFVYRSLDDYQKERILNFFNPTRDVAGSGLQAIQGRIAIGSGQLRGRGFLKGVQNQNNFIPEKHTDFIFPVLAEELGFLGVSLVLGLYGLVLYRILVTAREAKDIYGSMVCMGVFGLLLVHIFENIGMTLGVMPITGIPLPFFSYGGTSQLVNLLAIGLVFHVRLERKLLDFKA